MSGGKRKKGTRRSHFIPRFLLAGFASRTPRGRPYAWVVRKGARPFETSIDNIGVEKDFYGEGVEDSLEHALNPMEDQFASVLRRIRGAESLDGLDHDLLWEMVAHLAIRSRHIRVGLRDLVTRLASEVRAAFMSAKGKDVVLRGMEANWEKEAEKFISEIARAGGIAPDDPRMAQAREAFRVGKVPAIAAFRKADTTANLQQVFDRVRGGLDPGALSARMQVEALTRWLAERSRWPRKAERTWRLVPQSAGTLILGDVVALGGGGPGSELAPLFSPRSSGGNIYLPLSDGLLLVGSEAPEEAPIDIDWLNRRTARSSREFFVTSRLSVESERHAADLGNDCEFLTLDEARQMVREKFDSM